MEQGHPADRSGHSRPADYALRRHGTVVGGGGGVKRIQMARAHGAGLSVETYPSSGTFPGLLAEPTIVESRAGVAPVRHKHWACGRRSRDPLARWSLAPRAFDLTTRDRERALEHAGNW